MVGLISELSYLHVWEILLCPVPDIIFLFLFNVWDIFSRMLKNLKIFQNEIFLNRFRKIEKNSKIDRKVVEFE